MTRLRSITVAATVTVAATAALGGALTSAEPVHAAPSGVDDTPPFGAVSGVQSPAAGTLTLLLDASDIGLGLANTEASLDERNLTFVRLGTGSCPERPVSNPTLNVPFGDCPETVTHVPLLLNTAVYPDGPHQLRVSVTDAAGNVAVLVNETIVIRNSTKATSATVTVGIGNQGASGSPTPSGGVLGSSSAGPAITPGGTPVACQLPDLSMRLVSRPLRYTTRHVPVLRSRRHYTYSGRLTCLLNNRRVSAPTGTVLRVFFTIGKRTYNSGRGTMTVHNGNLSARLAYYNSRTIIFRYKPGNGEFAQVELPIEIVRPRPKHRARG